MMSKKTARMIQRRRPPLTKKQKRIVEVRAFLDELEATNTLVAIHIRHLKRLIRRARHEGIWVGIVP